MAPTTPPQPQPQPADWPAADWPAADLIRVVKGYETGVGLTLDRLAMRDVAGSYRLLGGGLLVPGTGDCIEIWKEMEAVQAVPGASPGGPPRG